MISLFLSWSRSAFKPSCCPPSTNTAWCFTPLKCLFLFFKWVQIQLGGLVSARKILDLASRWTWTWPQRSLLSRSEPRKEAELSPILCWEADMLLLLPGLRLRETEREIANMFEDIKHKNASAGVFRRTCCKFTKSFKGERSDRRLQRPGELQQPAREWRHVYTTFSCGNAKLLFYFVGLLTQQRYC